MPNSIKESEINTHLVEIQRRQLGYAFGGPAPHWCQAERDEGVRLPLNPDDEVDGGSEHRTFTGCLKYSKCNLIDDAVRWVPWEKLTRDQQESLKKVRCYRATSKWWNPEAKRLDPRRRAGWDPNALESRRSEEKHNQWIGNPFGIRTPESGSLANEMQERGYDPGEHRDLSPCPVGGCVTPEMERDYRWEIGTTRKTDWTDAEACPLFYRHINSNLTDALPNPQRFTQCYVTLPGVRELLAQKGIIAVAPIFRASEGTGSIGESFWYPFYSGYSFLQLPTRAPADPGWQDPTLQLRWQATTTVRQQMARVFRTLPIQKLFEGVEKGDLLAPWEKEVRIVSVSEGQASTLLLQWLLINRLKAAIRGKSRNLVDITSKLEWCYEDWSDKLEGGVCRKLSDLGYDLSELHIELREESAYRHSSLEEDLRLLGLIGDDRQPTERLQCGIRWLCASLEKSRDEIIDPNDLRQVVREWLSPALPLIQQFSVKNGRDDVRHLWMLCWILLHAAVPGLLDWPIDSISSLKKIPIQDADKLMHDLEEYERGIFARICRLIPPVHVIVRAYWQSPVRWIFMPIGEASQVKREDGSNALRARVNSGLIILLEDDLNSRPYRPGLPEEKDEVLKRLQSVRRLISAVGRIEESHVRDDLISTKEWWDFQRTFAEAIQHNIYNTKDLVSNMDDASAKIVSYLLTHLESLFFIPPEGHVSGGRMVSVDIIGAAQSAIEAFEAINRQKKQVSINLLADDMPHTAKVRPMFGVYDEEGMDLVEKRARSYFELFLFDLLRERVKKHSEVYLHLRRVESDPNRIAVEMRLPVEFDERQIWDSEQQTLDYWPRRRGFYSSFSWARSLGSRRQAIFNDRRAGVIRLEFDRG